MYKYFLRPTAEQRSEMDRIRRVCCELYNAALQERRDAWRTARKSISFKQQSAQLPAVKAERSDVGAVYAQVLQDVLRRLKKTFEGFFRRVQVGQTPGYPRFKSHHRYDSFTFPQVDPFYKNQLTTGGVDLLPNRRLRIHGIPGDVKVKFHRPWAGRPKTATFKREGNRWYLILTCEQDAVMVALPPSTDLTAGIDVGLTDFATFDVARGGDALPEAEQPAPVPNPRHLRVAKESLTRAQQRLDHHERGSARRGRARALFAKQSARVANARRDFHHKLALDLVRRFDRIAVEALDVAGMLSKDDDNKEAGQKRKKQKRGLRRSISDAGWGQFLSMLAYKAESAGRELARVEPRGTTQECSGCGAVVPKTLWERMHRCPCCGLVMTRDRNAARNIRQRAFGREAAVGEGGACAA